MEEMESLNNGNVLFLPDVNSLHSLPWAGVDDYKVGEVICEAYWNGGSRNGESRNKGYIPSSCRSTARKQLQRLLEHGYGLKDASAFNVQFERGRAVFIDVPSIERPRRLDTWIAYGQFCRMFLFPMALTRYRRILAKDIFLANIDGIDVEDAGHPPEHRPFGVHQKPLLLNFAIFGQKALHRVTLILFRFRNPEF